MAAEQSYHSSPSIRDSHNFATSSPTSFNPTFEAQVNANMTGQNDHQNWSDAKCKAPIRPTSYVEADDSELNEKTATKQKSDLPPRFSTIFGPPAAPVQSFESYPQETRRRSGVYIAAPLFWALFAVFLIMSAALFAYTVIGIFNNMPTRLVGGSVAPLLTNPQQPVINVSPNFVMGQAPQQGEKETVTVTVTTTYSQSLTSSSRSSSSISSSSSTSGNSTQAAGMIASEIAGILHSQSTSTTSSSSTTSASAVPPVTVTINPTPTRSTVSSTVLLTVDASGHTLPPQSTVTSTTVIDQAQAAAWTSSVEASIQSALAENSKHLIVPAASSSTTDTPSTSSEAATAVTATTDAPSTLITSTVAEPTTSITTSTEATPTHEKETCPGLPGRSPPCPK